MEHNVTSPLMFALNFNLLMVCIPGPSHSHSSYLSSNIKDKKSQLSLQLNKIIVRGNVSSHATVSS